MGRRLPDPDDSLFESAHEREREELERALGMDRPGPMEDLPAEDKSGSLEPHDDREPEVNPMAPGKEQRPYVDSTGFTILPNWFQKHCLPVFSLRGLRVMMAFYRRADRAGRVVVSQATLAEETRLHRRHLQRTLDRLEQTTIIEVVKPGTFGKSTQYRLTPVERVNLRLPRRGRHGSPWAAVSALVQRRKEPPLPEVTRAKLSRGAVPGQLSFSPSSSSGQLYSSLLNRVSEQDSAHE